MSKNLLITNSLAEEFIDWSLNLNVKKVPMELKTKIKLILLDSFGLMIAARNQDYIKSMMNSFTETGVCHAIGHKKKPEPV